MATLSCVRRILQLSEVPMIRAVITTDYSLMPHLAALL